MSTNVKQYALHLPDPTIPVNVPKDPGVGLSGLSLAYSRSPIMLPLRSIRKVFPGRMSHLVRLFHIGASTRITVQFPSRIGTPALDANTLAATVAIRHARTKKTCQRANTEFNSTPEVTRGCSHFWDWRLGLGRSWVRFDYSANFSCPICIP